MKTLYGHIDNVGVDPSLSDLKWEFDNGLSTLTGYAYKTIQRLELEEIHLDWLACRMGAQKESLRYAIKTLQKRSLINVQFVRQVHTRIYDDEELKIEDTPTPPPPIQPLPNNQQPPTPTQIDPTPPKT